jgi:glycosyltransferase involved in cell wall biosynthesis
MTVSVLIPAYNSETTIQSTLESVLRQTVLPDEILVMDDGSTDNTPSILDSYKPRITVFRQANGGLSSARNALIELAHGDLIAFLDSDDIWHPRYLEVQLRLFQEYPDIVAFFAGHVDFHGYGPYQWEAGSLTGDSSVEIISPLSFFERYNEVTGLFGSYSFCCVPKRVLTQIGREPFKIDGAEDNYCSFLLALLGPVLRTSMVLGAYRIRKGSLSSKPLLCCQSKTQVFELLRDRYVQFPDPDFYSAFKIAFASHKRQFGKFLMGAGKSAEARKQFWDVLRINIGLRSITKSLGLLFLTYAPPPFRIEWPSGYQKG